MRRVRGQFTRRFTLKQNWTSDKGQPVPFPVKPDETGFDEFGYNYQARLFSGLADGVDRVLDGKVWGEPNLRK